MNTTSLPLSPLVTLTSTCNLWQWRNEAAIIWLIYTDYLTNWIYLQTRPCFWDWSKFYWKSRPWWQETSGTTYKQIILFFPLFPFIFLIDTFLRIFPTKNIRCLNVLFYGLFFFVYYYPLPSKPFYSPCFQICLCSVILIDSIKLTP